MKKLLLACLLAVTLWAPAAEAAVFANPTSAVITPQGARLEVQSQVEAQAVNGQIQAEIFLPPTAELDIVRVSTPKWVSILRWSVDKASLPAAAGSSAAQNRQALQQERDQLQGDIAVLKTRLELWTSVPSDWAQDKLDAREARLITVLPQIVAQLAQKQRDLSALEERIKALPPATYNAKRVRVLLSGEVKSGTPLTLHYTYTMADCSWQPHYRINASNDSITVALEAAVEQHSGFDWTDTHVTLSLQNTTQRTPPTLNQWYIRNIADNDDRPRMMGNMRAAASMANDGVALSAAPKEVKAFTSEYGAGWELDKSVRVPEGVSYLPIVEDVWMDRLQRLARPAQGDNRVWLTAEHVFEGTPLPPGKATYLLDGSPVGQGMFAPVGTKVTLAFGADPLCNVRTDKDPRVTGSTGIIDRKQTWRWGWVYTATNNRDKDVSIRIEDAEPRAGDTAIKVTLEDDPVAAKGEKNSMFWDVNVPAKGSATVRHIVRVEAPKDMNISVGR